MKSLKSTKRIAMVFAAVILAMLMGSAAVFAADANNDGYDDETGQPINPGAVPQFPENGAHVSKIVKYNDHQNFDLTFNYEATATQVTLTQTWDGTKTETTKTQPTTVCPAVTISPIRVVVDANTTYSDAGIRVPKANMSDTELAANTQGVITFGSGSSTGAAAFPHAGVYAYTITETGGATTGFNGNASGTDCLTYDDQEYLMRVYVVNGANGLEIEGITVENEAGQKVARADILFTNTYIEEADALDVKKLVAGSGADMTKDFNFTVNFTAPSLIRTMPNGDAWDPTQITVTKKDSTGQTATTDVTVNASGAATFTLKHNEEMIFGNLPVGATYTVKETGLTATGYTPKGQAVQNAETRDAHVGTRDTDYTSDSAFVGEAENKYTVTNTADDITITGLMLHYMPIILLAILAIAAVLVYRTVRRRMVAR